MKKIFLSIILSSLLISAFAQPAGNQETVNGQKIYYQPEDRFIFDRYVAYIYDKTDLPADQLIIETAKFFLGVPYVASTLEKVPEGLVINLRELDCTTFVETVYALSMTAKSKDLSWSNYCNKLRWLRYREGVINDYTDRLHYTSDWIFANHKKGIVKNVSRRAGGERLNVQVSIMSANTDKYKQLKGQDLLISKIKEKESEINSRRHYYLPAQKIEQNSPRLKSGDIVGFVTTVPGLDISHVGLIYKEGDKLTFIHASSTQRKVIINKEPLAGFVKGSSRNSGIVVVRPVFWY